MPALKLIWIPEPQNFPAADTDALILSQEQETRITATVTAEPSEDVRAASALAWAWPDEEPLHKEITWTKKGNRLVLTVLILDWVGVFQKSIAFMRDGTAVGIGQTPGAVEEWDGVPAAQADIYSYIPDPVNVKRFRLAIDALDNQKKVIETAEYTITVYANYTLGRNLLKATVQTRKETYDR